MCSEVKSNSAKIWYLYPSLYVLENLVCTFLSPCVLFRSLMETCDHVNHVYVCNGTCIMHISKMACHNCGQSFCMFMFVLVKRVTMKIVPCIAE